MLLHGFDISSMEAGESFLHIEQFLLVLSLAFVQFALQELYFLV